MATHDSSLPVDNEKAHNGQAGHVGTAQRDTRMKFLDFVLRFLTFACTLSAFIVMITNKQFIRPFEPISPIKLWAKYHYSDAFMWFVVANALAFSYSLLTLLSSAFNYSPKIGRFILLLDLIVSYILMSAASAATAIAYIGKNGLAASDWNPICNRFHRYCAHVLGALFACYMGWLYLTFLIILTLKRR